MESVDWQTGKTNSACSRYMLENQLNCDVNFRVGENGEVIKGHKLILSMRSAVFDRMFNGSFCEADIDPVIPDVTPAAFKMLLRYCYYECLDVKDDTALSVLYASTKYMLPLLEEAARKKLIEALSGSNIWATYEYAINVGDTRLLEECNTFFQGNITPVKEALQAEAFLNIPHKVLQDFLHINNAVDDVASLNQNQGNIPESNPADGSKTDSVKAKKVTEVNYKNVIGISISEIELFKACNAWADAEALRQEIESTSVNKRTVLGECLSLIRIPTMLPKDLLTVVYPTGILTPVEVVNLGQFLHKDPGAERQVDFPSRERQFVVTSPEFCDSAVVISTVYIESAARVMLSRLWILYEGSYRVTVSDLSSDSCSSRKYESKFKGHATKIIGSGRDLLPWIDIEPLLLESSTKYSITAERIKYFDDPDQGLVIKWVNIEDLPSFKEVKLTCDPTKKNNIYALTLCLV